LLKWPCNIENKAVQDGLAAVKHMMRQISNPAAGSIANTATVGRTFPITHTQRYHSIEGWFKYTGHSNLLELLIEKPYVGTMLEHGSLTS
jgi:hypothetical protein